MDVYGLVWCGNGLEWNDCWMLNVKCGVRSWFCLKTWIIEIWICESINIIIQYNLVQANKKMRKYQSECSTLNTEHRHWTLQYFHSRSYCLLTSTFHQPFPHPPSPPVPSLSHHHHHDWPTPTSALRLEWGGPRRTRPRLRGCLFRSGLRLLSLLVLLFLCRTWLWLVDLIWCVLEWIWWMTIDRWLCGLMIWSRYKLLIQASSSCNNKLSCCLLPTVWYAFLGIEGFLLFPSAVFFEKDKKE